jgi:hypothetical protein
MRHPLYGYQMLRAFFAFFVSGTQLLRHALYSLDQLVEVLPRHVRQAR